MNILDMLSRSGLPTLPSTGIPLDATPKKLTGHPGLNLLDYLAGNIFGRPPEGKWFDRQPGSVQPGIYAEPNYNWELGEVDAWHGSPHKFSKFMTSKMGTGEGHQAFGWGLYFTDKKSIAEGYAKDLASRHKNIDVDEKTFNDLKNFGAGYSEDYIREVADKWFDYQDVNKAELKYFSDDDSVSGKIVQAILDGRIKRKAGQTYKVKLHKGKDPSEYTWLDWDKPLSNDNTKKILDLGKKELNEKNYNSLVEFINQKTFMGVELNKSGEFIYRKLTQELGSKQEASLFLLRSGIDGIRYPSGTLSGIKDSASKNYVVFDDSAITTAERSGGGMRKIFINKPLTFNDRVNEARKSQ